MIKRIAWNKGKLSGKFIKCVVCNKEFYLQPFRIKRKTRCCSYECRTKYYPIWNKGLTKETDERVAKNANSLKGRKPIRYWLGKKRWHMRGSKHPRWKGGVASENNLLRNSLEYKQWRRDVFIRDIWTCQECGIKSVKIEAHHIKPWKDYPNLRFNVSNGLTLCKSCHARKELSLRLEV